MEQPPPISDPGPHPLVLLLTFAPLRRIFTGTPVPLHGYRSIPALKQSLENHPWRKFWFIRSEDRLLIEPKPLLPFSLGGSSIEFVGEVTGEEERAEIRGRFVFPFAMKMAAVFLIGFALVIPNSDGVSLGSLCISVVILIWINIMCWMLDLFSARHQRVITEALHQSSVP